MFDIFVYSAYFLQRCARLLKILLLLGLVWAGWYFFTHRAPAASTPAVASASASASAVPASQPAVPPAPGAVRGLVDAAAAIVDDCWRAGDQNARNVPGVRGDIEAADRLVGTWVSRSLCVGRNMSAWIVR